MDVDDEVDMRQRVTLAQGARGVGVDVQAQGRAQAGGWQASGGMAQGAQVGGTHVDGDQDQARADALCAREMEFWQSLRGPVVQVRVPEVPRMVVYGFDVHEGAAATGGFLQAGGSLEDIQEDAAGEEGEGLAAVDAAPGRQEDQAGPGGDLVGLTVHAVQEEQASEVEERFHAAGLGGRDIMGRPVQHEVSPGLHDSDEEAEMGSAFTDVDVQVGLPQSVDDTWVEPSQVAGLSGSQQAGEAQYAALLDLFEERWSGPAADSRGLGVRLACAAAAFCRWALW